MVIVVIDVIVLYYSGYSVIVVIDVIVVMYRLTLGFEGVTGYTARGRSPRAV